jgi:hypothetical protein
MESKKRFPFPKKGWIVMLMYESGIGVGLGSFFLQEKSTNELTIKKVIALILQI